MSCDEQRSLLMAKVKSKNTRPEKAVRALLHKLGYRFRLHSADLPGRPDVVLPKYRIVIFINGCFWHQHIGCKKAIKPKTNTEFWDKKLSRNVERDMTNIIKLQALGWNTLIVWECELNNLEILSERLLTNLPKN